MRVPTSIKVQGAIKSFIIKNNIWDFYDFVKIARKQEDDFMFEMSSRYTSYCLFLINDRKRKIFNSKKTKKSESDIDNFLIVDAPKKTKEEIDREVKKNADELLSNPEFIEILKRLEKM
ncbi:hypothetical protein MFERI13461_00413 [Mycoplasma feriruminatoris]|uniref:hypothetical protein n=1 Tax=Mycoplasma feriruminatoris TaxID=1179777 RepID=UPI00241FEADA|nr:hypothetical protein [Mycoplasma feriruminatoris]WFQ90980.1 hypothetical protein MFERI13461_00413 [Mycoplasma feriruminatoris]